MWVLWFSKLASLLMIIRFTCLYAMGKDDGDTYETYGDIPQTDKDKAKKNDTGTGTTQRPKGPHMMTMNEAATKCVSDFKEKIAEQLKKMEKKNNTQVEAALKEEKETDQEKQSGRKSEVTGKKEVQKVKKLGVLYAKGKNICVCVANNFGLDSEDEKDAFEKCCFKARDDVFKAVGSDKVVTCPSYKIKDCEMKHYRKASRQIAKNCEAFNVNRSRKAFSARIRLNIKFLYLALVITTISCKLNE